MQRYVLLSHNLGIQVWNEKLVIYDITKFLKDYYVENVNILDRDGRPSTEPGADDAI